MCRNATYMRIWPNVRLELQNKQSYSSLKHSWKGFNDDDLGVAYDFIWIFLILMATYLWFFISLADGKILRPNKMYKHENVLNYFPAFLGIKASFTSPNYKNAEQNPTYMSISWKIISEDWRPFIWSKHFSHCFFSLPYLFLSFLPLSFNIAPDVFIFFHHCVVVEWLIENLINV